MCDDIVLTGEEQKEENKYESLHLWYSTRFHTKLTTYRTQSGFNVKVSMVSYDFYPNSSFLYLGIHKAKFVRKEIPSLLSDSSQLLNLPSYISKLPCVIREMLVIHDEINYRYLKATGNTIQQALSDIDNGIYTDKRNIATVSTLVLKIDEVD